jgi:hypothetical protein
VIIAIDQIGIAADLVNTLFIGVVGAFALAFGLAFGLGGRDVAAELTRSWYEASQGAAAQAARAQGSAPQESRAQSTRTTTAGPDAAK